MDRDRPRSPANRNCYRLWRVSRALAQISCLQSFGQKTHIFKKYATFCFITTSCYIYFCKVPISYTDFMAVIVVFYFGFVFFMLK